MGDPYCIFCRPDPCSCIQMPYPTPKGPVFCTATLLACEQSENASLAAENAWLRHHLAEALRIGGEECERLRATVQFWSKAANSKCRCCVSSAIDYVVEP